MLFLIPKPIRRLIYLGVLLGLLAAGDVYARVWAEGQVETRAEEAWKDVAGVDVTFTGFPFVGRIAAFGEVESMEVRLREVVQQSVTFSTIGLELRGIAMDREVLLRDRKFKLRDLESGTAFGELTEEEISRLVGATIQLEPGRAIVVVGGQQITASVALRDGRVVITPQSGPALSLPVPTSEYLPCAADLTVLKERIRVSCSIDTIPEPLVTAVGEGISELQS